MFSRFQALKSRRRGSSYRRVVRRTSLAMLIVAASVSCRDASGDDAPPANPMIGKWVRINPPSDNTDTLELRIDGSATGDAGGLERGMGRVSRWRIGIEVMPDGFCFAETSQWHCQAYSIRSDTLSLANAMASRYVRVSSR